MTSLRSLRTIAAIVLVALVSLVSVVPASAQAQAIQRKGYFGTVAEISSQKLKLTTKDGILELNVIAETTVSTPGKEQAAVADVKAGDKIAVLAFDQSGNLIARQIRVIPAKPSTSHKTGVIIEKTANTLTIQDEAGTKTVIDIPAGVTDKELGQLLTIITRKGPSSDRDTLVTSATADRIKERLAAIAEKGGDMDQLRSTVDRFNQTHLRVLEKVLAKAPSAALDGIKNAIENSKKGNAKAMDTVDKAIKARQIR